MIKILKEEPVAIKKGQDNDSYWIFKNPTSDEVEELKYFDDEFRVLLKGKDYYIASAYRYVHPTMASTLFDITKLNYKDYDACYTINLDKNEISASMLNMDKEEKAIDYIIKRVYNEMESVGLINSDTSIIAGYSDTEYEGFTFSELMNW